MKFAFSLWLAATLLIAPLAATADDDEPAEQTEGEYKPPESMVEKTVKLVTQAMQLYALIQRLKDLKEDIDEAKLADIERILASLKETLTKEEMQGFVAIFATLQSFVTDAKAKLAATAEAVAKLTPKCETPTSEGDAECWLKAANQNNCYVWTGTQSNPSFTWSGQCKMGIPDGHGEVVWRNDDGEGTHIGTYVDGEWNGQWEHRWANGQVHIGPYVDGKKNGQWEIRHANGTVHIGPIVDGKWHGQWELRYADGQVHIGPYVDGKKNGQWEERYVIEKTDWNEEKTGVSKGPYVDGKRHGRWEIRHSDGTVKIGPFVDGKRHGEWEETSPYFDEGMSTDWKQYVDGEEVGFTKVQYPDGHVQQICFNPTCYEEDKRIKEENDRKYYEWCETRKDFWVDGYERGSLTSEEERAYFDCEQFHPNLF